MGTFQKNVMVTIAKAESFVDLVSPNTDTNYSSLADKRMVGKFPPNNFCPCAYGTDEEPAAFCGSYSFQILFKVSLM